MFDCCRDAVNGLIFHGYFASTCNGRRPEPLRNDKNSSNSVLHDGWQLATYTYTFYAIVGIGGFCGFCLQFHDAWFWLAKPTFTRTAPNLLVFLCICWIHLKSFFAEASRDTWFAFCFGTLKILGGDTFKWFPLEFSDIRLIRHEQRPGCSAAPIAGHGCFKQQEPNRYTRITVPGSRSSWALNQLKETPRNLLIPNRNTTSAWVLACASCCECCQRWCFHFS